MQVDFELLVCFFFGGGGGLFLAFFEIQSAPSTTSEYWDRCRIHQSLSSTVLSDLHSLASSKRKMFYVDMNVTFLKYLFF